MKRSATLLLLSLACLLGPLFLSAQDTSRVQAHFRVLGGFGIGDTSFIIINGGSKLGVKANVSAIAFSVRVEKNGVEKRAHKIIGYGKVTKVFPDSAVCVINQVSSGNSTDSIWVGDLIKVSVNLPARKYPSVHLSLALQGIFFNDVDMRHLYDLSYLLKEDGPKTDDIIFEKIQAEFVSVYERFQNRVPASLKDPIGEGRFKGRYPMSLLKELTRDEIDAFFSYVESYPANYMGQEFRLVESYLGWATSGGMQSPGMVFKGLYPIYKDKNAFASLMPKYAYSIRKENMIRKVFGLDSIQEANSRGQKQLALSYADFLWAMASNLNDTAGKAAVMISRSKISDAVEDKVRYCDSAMKYALLAGDYHIYFDGHLEKAEALVRSNKYQAGREALGRMSADISRYRTPASSAEFDSLFQLKVQYSAWLEYMQGNLGAAIELYKEAARLNNLGDRTMASRANNALTYKRLGEAYKKQGNTKEAIRYLMQSAALYDTLNRRKDMASTWNEIGSSYYNLGSYREAAGWFEKAISLNEELKDNDNLGYGKSMIANCLLQYGKTDSAILLHKEAIALRKDVNLSGAAYSWDRLGELYNSNGYKKLALEAFGSSRAIYNSLRDSSSLSDNYLNVGLVYHGDEDFKRAIKFYDSSIAIAPTPSPYALFDQGLAWSSLQKTKAIPVFRRALQVTDSLKNLGLQFSTLTSMATDAYVLGNTEDGDRWYGMMDKLMKEVGSPARTATMYEVKAVRALVRGALDSSYLLYDKARRIYDTVSKISAANAMRSMADIHTQKGEFREALRWMDSSLRYSSRIGSVLGMGISYNGLSLLYAELGQVNEAVAASDSATAIFRRVGSNLRYASALIQKGILFLEKGDFKDALEKTSRADSIYIAEEAVDYRRTPLNNIGVVYFNQADYARAINYFQQAANYYSPSEVTEDVLINRSNIAECFYRQRRYDEARKIYSEFYPKAVQLGFRRIAASMASIQSDMSFELGNISDAARFSDEVFRYGETSGSVDMLAEGLVMKGKVSAAKGDLKQAESLIRSGAGKGIPKWAAYYELGMVYYQQKNYDSAIANFKIAVEIVEKIAGNLYGGDEARKLFSSDPRKVDLYNKIIASYVAVKDPAKASEYALRNSITAINSKYGKDLGFADSTLKADLAKAEELRRQIDVVDASIAKADSKEKKEALLKTRRILEEGYQNFLDERKEKYNDFSKFLGGNVNPEDLSNFKGGLPDDLAVVSFVVNDSQLYKFIVTNSTLEIVTTVLDSDINVMVNDFISSLTTPDSASGTGVLKVRAEFVNQQQVSVKPFRQTSEALYHVLMEDLKPVIGDKKKLCIIPSGKLSNIPFQCLGKMENGKFRFLIEDYRVFYTNRMDMFRQKGGADKDLSNMAAFGNPDRTLAYAGKEVLSIQKIANARQVLTEDKATEQEARAALLQRKYIHFATHGTLDYVKPKQSYLTFTATPGSGDDGKLTISEIDSLKAPAQYAELVTLSACETARPLAISDDWYVSPANSFLRKKFKTVVASLWQVNDEATGLLMTEFYKNLEKMDKVDALRLAQQKVSTNPKYTHPYYWGGFVLYGDWR